MLAEVHNFDWCKGLVPDERDVVHANGFLLAGGQSSRMGRDKAELTLGGQRLGERALEKLRVVCRKVCVVGDRAELASFGVPVIPDAKPGCGPLGGIVAGLEQSELEWNLFLAVDMPFVPVETLRSLLFVAQGWPSVAVVVEVDGRPQPLCGVYSKRALPRLRQDLEAGRWKVMSAIQAAGTVKFMPVRDPQWFRNLNTPEDFVAAEQHLKTRWFLRLMHLLNGGGETGPPT